MVRGCVTVEMDRCAKRLVQLRVGDNFVAFTFFICYFYRLIHRATLNLSIRHMRLRCQVTFITQCAPTDKFAATQATKMAVKSALVDLTLFASATFAKRPGVRLTAHRFPVETGYTQAKWASRQPCMHAARNSSLPPRVKRVIIPARALE